MGMTVEFISANPQALLDVFNLPTEEVELFFTLLQQYLSADFSFHLSIPEDLDRLCQSMRKQQLAVPTTFRDVLVEQVWYDGSAESLTLVEKSFASVWMRVSDQVLERVAADWVTAFHAQGPLHQTPAYQALLSLRDVARDVITRNTSLILHLAGSSSFLRS